MIPIEELPLETQEKIRRAIPGRCKYVALVQTLVGANDVDEDGSPAGDKVGVVLPEMPFGVLMVMTEYCMHLCAQRSGAGYERAMELLVKGAMTYRTEKK